MSIGQQLLYAAQGLLREPEGGAPAAGLYRAYLELPESERTKEGTASAAWYIENIESGDFARRHANDLKKAELIAEINVLLGVAGLGKKQRTPAQIAARRQRTRFRRELGLAVAQHLRDGDKEKDIRARHGVSGFTVSRAYGWIKRHHFRDKDMSNEEMRRRLRAEGKQQQEEERASSPDGESTADKREELERLREQARRMVELARREDPAFCADMDDDEY